jgi:hypothetical protein
VQQAGNGGYEAGNGVGLRHAEDDRASGRRSSGVRARTGTRRHGRIDENDAAGGTAVQRVHVHGSGFRHDHIPPAMSAIVRPGVAGIDHGASTFQETDQDAADVPVALAYEYAAAGQWAAAAAALPNVHHSPTL